MKVSKSSNGFTSKKSTLKSGFGGGKGKGKSRTQANVAGYEKRQARKAQSGPASSDLYEHIQPEKGRRAKVGLDLDREEAMEYAVGLDEEEREELRARLIGETQDDEEIASEDDEEIDSDAAFEESDEERFAGFFSSKKSKAKSAKKQKSKPAVRFADVNLDEDEDMESNDDQKAQNEDSEEDEEEEEEEGDDDEFINLLDVLDGKGEIDMGSDNENAPKQKPASSTSHTNAENDEDEELEDDEGDSEEESEDEPDAQDEESEDEPDAQDEKMVFEPSDDEDVPEALDQLQNFVSNLDVTAKKRKAPEEDSGTAGNNEARARKRRFTKERTEAGDENEFRAHSSGSKLNLEDLLAPLASQSSTLLSLKKSTKVLAPSSSSKAKALSAPLPQRTQERLDRQAAYEQTKEEVDKWTDTMKRIREAEHLSFPLQAQSTGRVSNLELNAKFKPTTKLESSVDALLKSAKMREEDIHHTEDRMLEMNKLSVEEVAQRRGELRKMRELMFRAEIKARRVGKIKSKTYRRLRRKEKERLGEKINEDEGSDGEEANLKQELERARERATLRHKHTGKWARQMRNKEGLDEDSRRDIEEMLARGEKLRRRIKGVGSDESEDGEEEEEEDDDDGMDLEGNIEKIKQGAFEELRKLDETGVEEEGEKRKGKSVFEMKFMKDAMARRAVEANREKDDFIKEMGGHVAGGDDSDEQEEDTQELDPSSGVVAQRAGGRVVYRPGAATSVLRPLGSLASDTSSVTLKSTDLISPPLSPSQNKRSTLSNSGPPLEQDSNPWLTHDTTVKAKAVKKAHEVIVGKDSKPLEKSKNKLKKLNQKRDEERERAKDDAVVEISLETVLTTTIAPSQARKAKSTQHTKPATEKSVDGERSAEADDSDDSDDDNIEIEAQEQALNSKGKGKANANDIKAFEQRDLVALAFAGDNVVQSFEEAKRREIASDAPREVDTTIPGWGSWAGTGVRKAASKPSRIKKIAGIDPMTRADYNKKNIIISEKRDKKAGKYLVKDLPYPYTSKAQFERAMERPLGVEWNTRVGFQRGTLPRVVKKPGVIIDPLEKQTA
ncbi:Utp14 protein-domain-containing protein [Flammula alnicola]|nr:Utp14 protein-domain-containing protein [Flammula alnicola]